MPDDIASRTARIEELLSSIGNFGSRDPAGSVIRSLLETIWKVNDKGIYQTLPADLDFFQHSVDHYKKTDANKDDHLRNAVYALAEASKCMLMTLSEKSTGTATDGNEAANPEVSIEKKKPSTSESLLLPRPPMDFEIKEEDDLFLPGDPAINPLFDFPSSSSSIVGMKREETRANSAFSSNEVIGWPREADLKLYSHDACPSVSQSGRLRKRTKRMQSEDYVEEESDEEWDERVVRRRSVPSGGNLRCANCEATEASAWRRNDEGELECNKCRLHFKRHGSKRPKGLDNTILRRVR
ncbi:hypothetical protein PMAYCL1PPCAC_28635 [Pristionchus mayeri]|uniref:GATA-type domain-containing protein n=1 Tax=Pristionchus mayeri TaxID=1317129 RepID=A0AAN5IBV3_9BILA|nr:hypothetical protein PMAYCL1PPCAC_28635 [Pristionchus mayeri]